MTEEEAKALIEHMVADGDIEASDVVTRIRAPRLGNIFLDLGMARCWGCGQLQGVPSFVVTEGWPYELMVAPLYEYDEDDCPLHGGGPHP